MMIVSIVPLTASAATVTGTFGDNLIWTYDTSTYTLTISGTGAMNDYVYNHPWKSSEDSIKNVVIEIGVTSIGEDAFYSCDSLTSVTIPGSVETIGSYAFMGCTSLKNVVICEGMTTISLCAFYDCTNLESVQIPSSVKIIDLGAFSGCTSLKDIYYSSYKGQWDGMMVAGYNEPIVSATIHFSDHSKVGLPLQKQVVKKMACFLDFVHHVVNTHLIL